MEERDDHLIIDEALAHKKSPACALESLLDCEATREQAFISAVRRLIATQCSGSKKKCLNFGGCWLCSHLILMFSLLTADAEVHDLMKGLFTGLAQYGDAISCRLLKKLATLILSSFFKNGKAHHVVGVWWESRENQQLS